VVREYTLRSFQDIHDRNNFKHDKPNYFSVGLKLTLTQGKYGASVCLAGDIDNYSLRRFPNDAVLKDIFDNNKLLKIPHHGSKNSDFLLRKKSPIIQNFDHAVTTTYTKKLPDPEVLDAYKSIGHVSVTNKRDTDAYGYVKYSLKLGDWSELQVEYEGDADSA
jgi:hypothetical protein